MHLMFEDSGNTRYSDLSMTSSSDPLLQLLHEQGGLTTARAATQAGLPSMVLTRAVEHGVIERVQRGVYRYHAAAVRPARTIGSVAA